MRNILTIFLVCISIAVNGQDRTSEIKTLVTLPKTKAQVMFLAADEMKGRDTGSPESNIAANFIRATFTRNNIKPVEGNSYFQDVPFTKTTPPASGSLRLGDKTFSFEKDFAFFAGTDGNISGDLVFAGYGSQEELSKLDVKGKIVVAILGQQGESNFSKALFDDAPEKNRLTKAAGARALIEIILHPGIPFASVANFLHKDRMLLSKDGGRITHVMVQPPAADYINSLKNSGLTADIGVKGIRATEIVSRNVIGVVEGTDPKLKKEFIILSAHYDHVGVGAKTAEGDSIFNGARDNALGTVALLSAAELLGNHPPKRSVLFIALTGEEKGLLGSMWYADHPVVPLKNCLFNLNADGAGYNDTTIVTINGLEYTATKAMLDQTCKPFDIIPAADPFPEMELYTRSDNFSFARMGIPAINLAPGLTSFDADISRYYHRQDDEADLLNYHYVLKYFQVYTNIAATLGNMNQVPGWLPGTKFESAGKALYK